MTAIEISVDLYVVKVVEILVGYVSSGGTSNAS